MPLVVGSGTPIKSKQAIELYDRLNQIRSVRRRPDGVGELYISPDMQATLVPPVDAIDHIALDQTVSAPNPIRTINIGNITNMLNTMKNERFFNKVAPSAYTPFVYPVSSNPITDDQQNNMIGSLKQIQQTVICRNLAVNTNELNSNKSEITHSQGPTQSV